MDYTYYFYGANKRADTAAVNDAMVESLTYRLAKATLAAPTVDADTKSATFYKGTSGDEKSDYTIKYSGTTPVDYTYYFYGANKRADIAAVNDAMVESLTFRLAKATLAAPTVDARTEKRRVWKGSTGGGKPDH